MAVASRRVCIPSCFYCLFLHFFFRFDPAAFFFPSAFIWHLSLLVWFEFLPFWVAFLSACFFSSGFFSCFPACLALSFVKLLIFLRVYFPPPFFFFFFAFPGCYRLNCFVLPCLPSFLRAFLLYGLRLLVACVFRFGSAICDLLSFKRSACFFVVLAVSWPLAPSTPLAPRTTLLHSCLSPYMVYELRWL